MTTAFGEKGLLSHDKKMVYADPARLAKVTAPALFLVGDRDRMCPPEGCRRTYQVIVMPTRSLSVTAVVKQACRRFPGTGSQPSAGPEAA
jgi:pimeloyl-ACP methyl ester carboxylesterase